MKSVRPAARRDDFGPGSRARSPWAGLLLALAIIQGITPDLNNLASAGPGVVDPWGPTEGLLGNR